MTTNFNQNQLNTLVSQGSNNIFIVPNDLDYFKNVLNAIQKSYELEPNLYSIDYDSFSKFVTEHNFSVKKIIPYFKNLNRVVNLYYSHNNLDNNFQRENFIQLWQHTFKFFQLNNIKMIQSNSHADFMNCITSCFISYFESYYKIEQKPKEEFTNLLNFLPVKPYNPVLKNGALRLNW